MVKVLKRLQTIAGLGAAIAATWAGAASAQTVTQVGTGIAAPAGIIKMGTTYWISDHLLGFCRINLPANAIGTIELSTCNTNAVSPGQAAFDPTRNFVYVPDNSSKSNGVWRLTFNPTTGRVGSPLLLRNSSGQNLGNKNTRPSTVALNGNGNILYIGYIKVPRIVRLDNPGGAQANRTQSNVARSSDGRGVSGMVFRSNTLYLAEGGGVTQIVGINGCVSGCTAEPTNFLLPGGFVPISPTAIAVAGADLYAADITNGVYKFNLTTEETTFLADRSSGGDPFRFVSALLPDGTDVLVGDDPADGGSPLGIGRVWKIAP